MMIAFKHTIEGEPEEAKNGRGNSGKERERGGEDDDAAHFTSSPLILMEDDSHPAPVPLHKEKMPWNKDSGEGGVSQSHPSSPVVLSSPDSFIGSDHDYDASRRQLPLHSCHLFIFYKKNKRRPNGINSWWLKEMRKDDGQRPECSACHSRIAEDTTWFNALECDLLMTGWNTIRMWAKIPIEWSEQDKEETVNGLAARQAGLFTSLLWCMISLDLIYVLSQANSRMN